APPRGARAPERTAPRATGRTAFRSEADRRGSFGRSARELAAPVGRGEDALDDALVARAAAQVASDGPTHVGGVGLRVSREQGFGGDQHAGRADAALRAAVIGHALLQWSEVIAVAQALHGHHLAAVALADHHQAGVDGLAIEKHRAAAALALAAALLGAGQS